jgi:hypothetical protein
MYAMVDQAKTRKLTREGDGIDLSKVIAVEANGNQRRVGNLSTGS